MKYDIFNILLLLAICFYTVGCSLIYEDKTYLQRNGIQQENVVYVDNDGEEHEEESLVEIQGLERY